MPQEDKPPHALFFRYRNLEIRALGIPAIIAVIVATLVIARLCGVL